MVPIRLIVLFSLLAGCPGPDPSSTPGGDADTDTDTDSDTDADSDTDTDTDTDTDADSDTDTDADSDTDTDTDADSDTDTDADTNAGDTGVPGCSPGDPDTDGDGVCDDADRCEGGDDLDDHDADGLPDACDRFLLPVEVLGVEGTVVERILHVASDQTGAEVRLWLRINNLGYENKASVRINGGPWLSLTHGTVELDADAAVRGGMAHGGMNTIGLTIPADALVPGENTLAFRFDLSDGISMGFRVVDIDLLRDDVGLLAALDLEEDDPDTWTAPIAGAAAITEGEDLWRNAPLWNHYLPPGQAGFWYSAALPERRPMQARCADCHPQDGRDLEIFAYSNHSIVERAKFHGLTEDQGERIASYIRALRDTYPEVERHGRPWNPPYQPGPAIASRPIEQWAAGAGLDAVLDSDADMAPHLFPSGLSRTSVDAFFDSDAMVDQSVVPVAIQLPDWKHWLPMIHPKDAYNADGFYDDPTVEWNPDRGYLALRAYLEGGDPLADGDALFTQLNLFWTHYRRFLSQGGTDEHWRTVDGDALTRGLVADVPMEWAATSLARHLAVKHFEVYQEFDLQDKAPVLVDPADQPSPRQWLGEHYQVFEVPPHFQGCVLGDCTSFVGQAREVGDFESAAWYQLQAVVNAGNGMNAHNSPVDYNYHPEFILHASRSSGRVEPLRYHMALNSMYQTKTWTGDVTPNDGQGFRIRVQGPWYFLGKEADAGVSQLHGWEPGDFTRTLDQVRPGLSMWVLDAQFRQFLAEMAKPSNALATWERWTAATGNKSNALDPITKSSVQDITVGLLTDAPLYADHLYWSIELASSLGADCTVMNDTIDWGEAAWPAIDWSPLRDAPVARVELAREGPGVIPDQLVAVVGNPGSSPTFEWTVDGAVVSETSSVLPSSHYTIAETVAVRVTTDAPCVPVPNREATASVWLAPSVFEPAVLNPVSWVDASALALSDGTPVDVWPDNQGSGVGWTAAAPDERPRYVAAGAAGLPVLQFGDGFARDRLVLDDEAAFADDWTVVVVGTVTDAGGGWTDTLGNKSGVGQEGWFLRFGADGRVAVSAGDAHELGTVRGLPLAFVASLVGDTDTATARVNGSAEPTAQAGSGSGTAAGDSVSLGSNNNPGRFHVGEIGEVWVFDRPLHPDELRYLESHLGSKWAIPIQR